MLLEREQRSGSDIQWVALKRAGGQTSRLEKGEGNLLV